MPKPSLEIAQLLVHLDGGAPAAGARSPGFPFAWEEAALKAVARYGADCLTDERPDSLAALPLGVDHVAVLRGRFAAPGQRRFRVLVVGLPLYRGLRGDPFLLDGRFPPGWDATGELAPLEWPWEPAPPRDLPTVQATLRDGDGPLLLGAAQALLDGNRVALRADEPAAATFVRDVWRLLPDAARLEQWPATLCGSLDLGFTAATLPAPVASEALTADQCRDYPEGRYELALQTAAEAGDAAELERLFARRTGRGALRLAAGVLLAAVAVAVASKLAG